MKKFVSLLLTAALLLGAVSGVFAEGVKYTTETTKDGWIKVVNDGGATLGYMPDSGVTLIEDDGFAFKDLNKNGKLDAYEDWRLSYEERAEDLASRMTVEQISGLRINGAFFGMVSDENATTVAGSKVKDEIQQNNFRYFIDYPVSFGATLDGIPESSNLMQSWAEDSALGIPMMLNCDPSNLLTGNVSNMAQAATADPDAVAELAKKVSRLYRAAGITMVLAPQVDLQSDPRSQSTAAVSEDPVLAADIVNAMISAMQSTYDADGNDLGWGSDSVAVQVKHFFANTANEGGRSYHDFSGSYTVVPEDQLEAQLAPFVDGAFNLKGETKQVSAIMVTYTVLCDENGDPYGENLSGAWNKYIMDTAAANGFTGMISTDALSKNTAYNIDMSDMVGANYGIFLAGVDQWMGGNTLGNVVEAYNMYAEKNGKEAADENWKHAAYQCLLPMFQVGNFENPYVETAVSKAIIAEILPETVSELAQSSIVMVKNAGNVIADSDENKKVWIANGDIGLSAKTLKNYFTAVETAEEADVVLVFVNSPEMPNTGYDKEAEKWVPISLQYGEYVADSDAVEEESLTGNIEDVETETPYGVVTSKIKQNRGYYGEKTAATNIADLELIHAAAATGKPVIVCVSAEGAFCVGEFEPEVSAILLGFGIDKTNFLPVASGRFEPKGLLPVQMPLNMETVEAQQPGTPRDMECYTDAEGNTYDIAFGLNWAGVIADARTAAYAG